MNILLLLQFTLSTLTKYQFVQRILPFTDLKSDQRVKILNTIFDKIPNDLERLTLYVSVVIHNNYTFDFNIEESIRSFDNLLEGGYTLDNYLIKMNIDKKSFRAKRFRYCYSTIRSKFRDYK